LTVIALITTITAWLINWTPWERWSNGSV